MAGADKAKKQEKKKEGAETQGNKKTTSKWSLLQWIVPVVVAAACSAAGFGLGRLLAGPGSSEAGEQDQQNKTTAEQSADAEESPQDDRNPWYYDLEPVVANLDEPGVTRYVRVALTLEFGPEFNQEKATDLLEEKVPLLRNWLTIYLASQSIENLRGDKNLRRVQAQILDAFNEKLFGNGRSRVRKILFKEFAIQ